MLLTTRRFSFFCLTYKETCLIMQMEERHNEIDQLITRYVSGKLDEASFSELKRWTMRSDANRKYVRQRLEIWFSSGVYNDETSFDRDKAFELFKQHVKGMEKKPVFSRKVLYRIAVVALILMLPLAYRRGGEVVKRNFADIVVEAPMGARTKLYLPDGTLVWLNAGSKVTYSQGFGADDRLLTLEGEGYFEVKRNEKVPFEISTKEVNLQVLGTKFNFKNYRDDEEVTVDLMEGKVALRNELKEMPRLYLAPNEKMVLNKLTGTMNKLKSRATHLNSWTNNELFFDEELLKDIAKRLMRSYNVQIEVADSSRNKRFYGSFKVAGNTIKEVLDEMAATKRMKYRYENDKYILY